MNTFSYGHLFRQKIITADITTAVGVYDAFSASIVSKQFDSIFVSGFGFAASHYGLPDIGFIAWPDMVNFVLRLRTLLPKHHLLVDIDDGYCDTEVACHVVKQLELIGASGVILEDQERPRKCGHFSGKKILPLPIFMEKLNRVLEARRDLVVVARTDAVEKEEILQRVAAFSETNADVILADGLKELSWIQDIAKAARGKPLLFNQIAGGKSPSISLTDLEKNGVKVVIYSTPCLFSVQTAIGNTLKVLKENDGVLPMRADHDESYVGVKECTAILEDNLTKRDEVVV